MLRKQGIAAESGPRAELRLASFRSAWLLAALMALYAGALIAGAAFKYANWGQGFDMVDFALPIWNTLHGRFLGLSRFNFTDTFMGLDVALGFLVALPFYALWPSPYTLVVVQTLLLASGAIPVYLIARRRFQNDWAGLAWATTYLLYPTTQFVNMTAPFQPRIPGLLCVFWAFYCFQQRKLLLFLLLLFLGMLSRSDAALIVIAFGIYAALSWRDWRWWAPPILLGAVYFYLAINVITPSFYRPEFRPERVDVPFDLSRDYNDMWPCGLSPQACYYAHLGGSLPAIAKNIVTHPLEVALFMLQRDKVVYLLLMFGTLLFLPLFAPKELLIAAPIFAINLLSTRVYQYVITEQYQILVIPGMIIAGIYGGARLWGWVQKRRPGSETQRPNGTARFSLFASFLLVQVLLVAALNIPLKNPVISTFRNPEAPERVALMERMKVMIPPDAAVAATSFLGPHLMPRQQLYFIPGGKMHWPIEAAQYAFIDTRAAALQGTGIVELLRSDPRWQLVHEEDDLLLFRQVGMGGS